MSTSSSGDEETKIVYGTENIINQMLQFFPKIKERYDICTDCKGVASFVRTSSLWHQYSALRSRVVRLRFLTEITVSNISYCREIMKVAELRHLDRLKTNFGIADGNIYLANIILADEHVPTQMIFSDANEFAEGQQYVFDTLWNKAIPAEQKIKEIEEGIPRYETTIMIQPDEIVKRIILLTETSNRLSICMTSGGLQFSYKYFFERKKKLLDKQKRGEHQGIKYLSYIDNDNIQIVKTFLDAGFQVRHVKNLPPLSFGISDKEAALTIEKMEGGKNIQTFLVSNDPQYVQHFTTIFEELWENGIDAKIRIEDIEAGRETDDELADAKRYLNEVLQEVSNMEKIAVRSEPR